MPIPNTPRVLATTSGALSAATVENSFFRSLDKFAQQVPPEIQEMFFVAKKSKSRQELYSQFGSTSTWKRWAEGESRKYQAFKEFYYTIVNKDYETTIMYHENTKSDDRTGTFNQRVNGAAKRWAYLDIDIAAQLLESQTNADLLDAIPNSYYGLSLFSTSYSFATNGNSINGSGYALESQIRSDLFAIQEQFRSMNDENGKRYWESGDVDFKNFVVIIPNTQTQIWKEALEATIVPGGFGQSSTKSNVLNNLGIRIYTETRLTDTNNWFVWLNASPDIKPFVIQPRQEPEFVLKDKTNSDHAFNTGMEIVGGKGRKGYSIFEPRSICRVVNA